MVPYLKGFHLTIEMWRGGRDVDGWKLKEGDDSLITSLNSPGSLDMTRAGTHGLDLGLAALFSATCGKDKDEAAANHRLAVKLGEEHVCPRMVLPPPFRGSRTIDRNCDVLPLLPFPTTTPLWAVPPRPFFLGGGDGGVLPKKRV